MRKNPFFDQNHGLTPLKNVQKCDYLSTYFYRLEIIRFYRKDPQSLFQDILPKTRKQKKISFFFTKLMG